MSQVSDASRLIGIALNPKARPGSTGVPGEYRMLLTRYLEDGEFADVVRQIAEGWGLEILDGDSLRGLMFAVRLESPFRATASDYLVGMTPADRAIYGLITLGIIAQCFPNPTDVDRAHEPKITIGQVNEYLSRIADTVAAHHASEPVPADQRLWRVCALFRRLADTKPGERAGSRTREGMIEKALTEMERAGLVREADEERGSWIATTRLRLRLRLGVGNDLIAQIRSAVTQQAT